MAVGVCENATGSYITFTQGSTESFPASHRSALGVQSRETLLSGALVSEFNHATSSSAWNGGHRAIRGGGGYSLPRKSAQRERRSVSRAHEAGRGGGAISLSVTERPVWA